MKTASLFSTCGEDAGPLRLRPASPQNKLGLKADGESWNEEGKHPLPALVGQDLRGRPEDGQRIVEHTKRESCR